jgi:hypothetical protein
MSPLINTEYNTEYNNIAIDIIHDDGNNNNINNNNIIHHNYQDDYDEEYNLLLLQEPTNYNFSGERRHVLIKKYMYYLAVMIISVMIEIYLLSKFLPTIMKNVNNENIDYLYE